MREFVKYYARKLGVAAAFFLVPWSLVGLIAVATLGSCAVAPWLWETALGGWLFAGIAAISGEGVFERGCGLLVAVPVASLVLYGVLAVDRCVAP